MACPGGISTICYTRLVLEIWSFTLNFSGKKAVIITSKHGTTIYFAHYNRILSPERRALILSEYIGMY